jgi:hypothetical protein
MSVHLSVTFLLCENGYIQRFGQCGKLKESRYYIFNWNIFIHIDPTLSPNWGLGPQPTVFGDWLANGARYMFCLIGRFKVEGKCKSIVPTVTRYSIPSFKTGGGVTNLKSAPIRSKFVLPTFYPLFPSYGFHNSTAMQYL